MTNVTMVSPIKVRSLRACYLVPTFEVLAATKQCRVLEANFLQCR